ncbi:hypothetical protein D3C71_2088910 [compost metagenome]
MAGNVPGNMRKYRLQDNAFTKPLGKFVKQQLRHTDSIWIVDGGTGKIGGERLQRIECEASERGF